MAEVFSQEWLDAAIAAFDDTLLAPETRAVVELTALASPDGDVVTTWSAEDGKLSARVGADAEADLALNVPWKDALAIARGDLEPAVAYMQGRLKGSGNMTLLLDLMRLGSAPVFKTWIENAA